MGRPQYPLCSSMHGHLPGCVPKCGGGLCRKRWKPSRKQMIVTRRCLHIRFNFYRIPKKVCAYWWTGDRPVHELVTGQQYRLLTSKLYGSGMIKLNWRVSKVCAGRCLGHLALCPGFLVCSALEAEAFGQRCKTSYEFEAFRKLNLANPGCQLAGCHARLEMQSPAFASG